MRFLRPSIGSIVFLIGMISIPQSLFSQSGARSSPPKQPASHRRQSIKTSGQVQRANALTAVIGELLKLDPLAPGLPESLDERDADWNTGTAGDSSEKKSNPPADDAPIKELIGYWSKDRDANSPQPSEKIQRRLLEACEDHPDLLENLVDVLPQSADTHDRLYKLLSEEIDGEEGWKPFLQRWLQRNSAYFRDRLIDAARALDDGQNNTGEELQALARLDREAARPILETFAASGKDLMAPIALALLYEHAAQSGDSTEAAHAESYRGLLKSIVANPQANRSARAEVLTSLMKSEWNGQAEWFASLFADPTLSNFEDEEIEGAAESAIESKGEAIEKTSVEKGVISTMDMDTRNVSVKYDPRFGILPTAFYGNAVLYGNLDRWLPIVSNLVGDNQRTVHLAAVKFLVKFLSDKSNWQKSGDEKKKKEIVQPLIPWLMDPNWASKGDRAEFIGSLKDLKMPELIPGLIWILENDDSSDNRAIAAEGLTPYADPRAVPALRRALEKEKDEEHREKIVSALTACGGFSDDEMAAAVEAYARTIGAENGTDEVERARVGVTDKPLPLNVSIGRILRESKMIQITDGLVVRLIERAKSLRATQSVIARRLLRVVEGAPLRVAGVNLIERIGEGWADIDSITLALASRDRLRKDAVDELNALLKQGGYAAGIAAAILNDEREWNASLAGEDAKAQLALLVAARYLREKLPVAPVGKLLDSPNHALANAAERYLEIEDGAEARRLILARHPAETYILGDFTAISGDPSNAEEIRKWEESLRLEAREQNGVDAIYAVLRKYSAENFFGIVVRVRGQNAELSVYETEGRRNTRRLTDGEFEELKRFTARPEVEDLGPESYIANDERSMVNFEYLRLTKENGRRIVLDALRRTPKNPTLHEELSGLFFRMSRTGDFATRYTIQDKISGVEVLFADRKRSVERVCGEGSAMRALILEKGADTWRNNKQLKPEWRELSSGVSGGVLGGITDPPQPCRAAEDSLAALKDIPFLYLKPIDVSLQSSVWLITRRESGAGSHEDLTGAERSKLIVNPIVTPDRKWLVAMTVTPEYRSTGPQLLRYNLQTGKEFTVKLPGSGFNAPAAYVQAHGKILLGYFGEGRGWDVGGRNYLLDPETGMAQAVKGEFGPLARGRARSLQPTGTPNEFWAALYDSQKNVTRFGRYDSRSFSFTPLLELPALPLTSDNIWVDAAAGKIWIAYQGQLLRLPLPARSK